MISPSTLRIDGVCKSFGSKKVLRDFSLQLCSGEVHALLGSNGAGKSTLAWLLAGRFRDYLGKIYVGDQLVELRSRSAALKHGIHIVTQEPALASNLSVSANLLLGNTTNTTFFSPARRRSILRKVRESLERFGLDFDLEQLVGALTLAQRQAIDLLRASIYEPQWLVVDEPPLSGTGKFIPLFTQMIPRLRDQGTGVLFITHQVSTALSLADTVTVIRDGHRVATRHAHACDETQVLDLMFPAIMAQLNKAKRRSTAANSNGNILEVWFSDPGASRFLNLSVPDGCVTGVQTSPPELASKLLRSVAGAGRFFDVVIKLRGQQVKIRSPQDALRQGMLYLSADREGEAVFPNLSVADNLSFYLLERLAFLGFIRRNLQQRICREIATEFEIDQERLGDPLQVLSGGNQQRTLLGRITARRPMVSLLDEPNRGIDVASLPLIERKIRALAESERGVLMAATDEIFLRSVSDRVIELEFGADSSSDPRFAHTP